MDLPEFERLTREPPPGLEHASRSLKQLEEHGFIVLKDYQAQECGVLPCFCEACACRS